MGVVVNKDEECVRVLFDLPHEGLHFGVHLRIQTHHVLVRFL